MSLHRIYGVFLRYFYSLCKGPQQLSDLFYWPLIDILLWGLTARWMQGMQEAPQLPQILLTALIFWQIAWRGSLDLSVSLLQEFWHRNLMNLFSTPLKLSEWALGVMLLSMGKLLVTVGFGALAVYLLYDLSIFAIGWAFFPFALSLLIFGWTLGFCASSLIIYWGHQIEAIAWMIGFVFAPFSAVFYPLSVLPDWAQSIAWCLPTTYVFEGMRQFLSGGAFPFSLWGMSLLLNALYFALSVAAFRFAFRKSCAKGLARLD